MTLGQFLDYELLDVGDGERLERWGAHQVRRPEPLAVGPRRAAQDLWHSADLQYLTDSGGHAKWQASPTLPPSWTVSYGDLNFLVKPTGNKQLGLFPEQEVNWQLLRETCDTSSIKPTVLNLFAYTGASTAVLASSGASVSHVDSSRTSVRWAQDNLALSQLGEAPVRFLVDDARKFVEREARRGRKYDIIMMDPPSFGRGPDGEVWKIDKDLEGLVRACVNLLSDTPLLFLVIFHTTGLALRDVQSMLGTTLGIARSRLVGQDIALKVTSSGDTLPCGARVFWKP